MPIKENGIRLAAFRYIDMLNDIGIRPKQSTESYTELPHIYWMLIEIVRACNDGDPNFDAGKLGRWLGFCQYAMIINGFTTVETERNVTREWFTK